MNGQLGKTGRYQGFISQKKVENVSKWGFSSKLWMKRALV